MRKEDIGCFVSGRLLKAFQIDFNWYHLAIWINITEQWPFRTSWMILHYDLCEESLEDSMSLKTLYDKYRIREKSKICQLTTTCEFAGFGRKSQCSRTCNPCWK